jgi:exopolysaccharide production protein ExoY
MSVENASEDSIAKHVPFVDFGEVGGWAKRLFDIFGAAGGIFILLPVLICVTLVLIATQGSPVFVRHRRIGARGTGFDCLKFRTMVVNPDEVLEAHLKEDPSAREEWENTRKLRHDPRVTPFGAVLRQTSVDELPQLFNVLLGHMSLVGPRPIVEAEIRRYGIHFREYKLARPGLTGLWQISGRSDVGYEARVRLDTDYVVNWNFARDLKIILRTVPAVLSGRGCY